MEPCSGQTVFKLRQQISTWNLWPDLSVWGQPPLVAKDEQKSAILEQVTRQWVEEMVGNNNR